LKKAGVSAGWYNLIVDVLGLLILLTIGLALGWAILVIFTAWTLAHPARRTYGWAVSRALPGDPSELTNANLEWCSWVFRARGLDLPVWEITGHDPMGPVVILTHGWGDSRVSMLGSGRVEGVLPAVSRLIVWDLPGHGDAPGWCTLGIHEPEMLKELIERVGGGDRPMVVWGFSLGARVSVLASANNQSVLGVVAEAPYLLISTPARNVLRLRGLPYRFNLWPALWLIRQCAGKSMASVRSPLSAEKLEVPLLVLHGEGDLIAPIEDGRELAAGTRAGQLVVIDGGAHQSMFYDERTKDTARHELRRFLMETYRGSVSQR